MIASRKATKVRYAVVGLGHISQVAVLPAFAHAKKNSKLSALVSSDPQKLGELGDQYKVEERYSYENYDACLNSGNVDAVYIALPNDMHRKYAVRAAEAGVHVLCEKPMAVTVDECAEMTQSAEKNNIQLMIAYRLHFDAATLKVAELIHAGEIGDPRFFNSSFGLQVQEDNIRLRPERGGGTLYDIGIYCINAARNIFRGEPTEVMAFTANKGESRFEDIEEMAGCVLRFPHDRLATFTSSFGSADIDTYHVIGTKGHLRMTPAFTYHGKLKYELTVGDKVKKQTFPIRDQFAPELLYFSDCILTGKTPEPSGVEGAADVRIIEALYRSAQIGSAVKLPAVPSDRWPNRDQEIHRPPVSKPETVHVESPRGD